MYRINVYTGYIQDIYSGYVYRINIQDVYTGSEDCLLFPVGCIIKFGEIK